MIDKEYGTEIDVRSFGSDLILNHEPFSSGEKLVDYLDEYKHGTLILNIKEAGIEDEVLQHIRKRADINRYFLLDVEFPYIYNATRRGEKHIAIRFSEDESIETVRKYINKLNWVWIDTMNVLPIVEKNISILNNFKKCLVCPERWGRPGDIMRYRKMIINMGIQIDAVMTSKVFSDAWVKPLK